MFFFKYVCIICVLVPAERNRMVGFHRGAENPKFLATTILDGFEPIHIFLVPYTHPF